MKPVRGFWRRIALCAIPQFIAGFAGAVEGDEFWDDRLGSSGCDGYARAIVAQGDDVYVGGQFSSAGGVPANNIARWNGVNWSALSHGIGGSVAALAVLGTEIYVGGSFPQAGGISASNIAKWDGTNWVALGPGLNGPVSKLAAWRNELYVAGDFTAAGGMTISNLARWDGRSWSGVGGGVVGPISALVSDDEHLYVGGQFSHAGAAAATNVARWDGLAWSALGNGLNTPPAGLALASGRVYALETGFETYSIKRWDGMAWGSEVAGSLAPPCCDFRSRLNAFAVFQGEFYVGGLFLRIDGVSTKGVARWNGTNWRAAGSGFVFYIGQSEVTQLSVIGPQLYAAGSFTAAGGVIASGVAKWNGTHWSGLGPGTGAPEPIRALIFKPPTLYAGGRFESPATPGVGGVGEWDGNQWSAPRQVASGSSVPPSFRVLALSSNSLYAVQGPNGIGRFTGTNWTPLGTTGAPVLQYQPAVIALSADGMNLYVGGLFNSVNRVPANSVARWNGSQWSALGGGITTGTEYGVVTALAMHAQELYAGGGFNQAGGTSANNIAKVDWNALGSAGRWHQQSGQSPALEGQRLVCRRGFFFGRRRCSKKHRPVGWRGVVRVGHGRERSGFRSRF